MIQWFQDWALPWSRDGAGHVKIHMGLVLKWLEQCSDYNNTDPCINLPQLPYRPGNLCSPQPRTCAAQVRIQLWLHPGHELLCCLVQPQEMLYTIYTYSVYTNKYIYRCRLKIHLAGEVTSLSLTKPPQFLYMRGQLEGFLQV